jgi:hypothetical protein
MTTTRINHTGHNHPNTTAARTACRKAMKTPVELPTRVVVGNGKAIHKAVLAEDGMVIGARCGAGLQRGVRKASSYRAIKTDAMTCDRCAK